MTTLYTLVMMVLPTPMYSTAAVHSVPNLSHATCVRAAQEFRTAMQPGATWLRAFCVEQAR